MIAVVFCLVSCILWTSIRSKQGGLLPTSCYLLPTFCPTSCLSQAYLLPTAYLLSTSCLSQAYLLPNLLLYLRSTSCPLLYKRAQLPAPVSSSQELPEVTANSSHQSALLNSQWRQQPIPPSSLQRRREDPSPSTPHQPLPPPSPKPPNSPTAQ